MKRLRTISAHVRYIEQDAVADRVGFEPTKGLHPCRFSRPVHSAALPPVRIAAVAALASNCGPVTNGN